ncbi:MAG: winged helix-turn-helix transcriptional regulator [Armatimonadetes bacterium]|nr:winged helix-turn-helix transcriptional regulator [Armatimonadota bacterium]
MGKTSVGARLASLYELQSAWLEPRLEAIGVSWTAFQLLLTVSAAGENASQTEVARRLGVTAPTLSESVQTHVAKGLLRQVQSKKDRRIKILTLTPKSQQLMVDIRRLVAEADAVMTRGLSERACRDLAHLLDQAAENFESSVR